MAVIDFHCHVLPGIDDGSRNTKMSVEMLQQEYAQGVDIVVATPHFYPERDNLPHFLSKRAEARRKLENLDIPDIPHLRYGAEVAYFPGIGKAQDIDEALCIEGTRTMLLEMPFAQWDSQTISDAEIFCSRGTAIVLAHVERYLPFQKDPAALQEILALPVFVQINAECLLSWQTKRKGIALFEEHTAHLLGSDAHNMTQRKPNLAAGREELEKRLGAKALRRIDRYGEALLSR